MIRYLYVTCDTQKLHQVIRSCCKRGKAAEKTSGTRKRSVSAFSLTYLNRCVRNRRVGQFLNVDLNVVTCRSLKAVVKHFF